MQDQTEVVFTKGDFLSEATSRCIGAEPFNVEGLIDYLSYRYDFIFEKGIVSFPLIIKENGLQSHDYTGFIDALVNNKPGDLDKGLIHVYENNRFILFMEDLDSENLIAIVDKGCIQPLAVGIKYYSNQHNHADSSGYHPQLRTQYPNSWNLYLLRDYGLKYTLSDIMNPGNSADPRHSNENSHTHKAPGKAYTHTRGPEDPQVRFTDKEEYKPSDWGYVDRSEIPMDKEADAWFIKLSEDLLSAGAGAKVTITLVKKSCHVKINHRDFPGVYKIPVLNYKVRGLAELLKAYPGLLNIDITNPESDIFQHLVNADVDYKEILRLAKMV